MPEQTVGKRKSFLDVFFDLKKNRLTVRADHTCCNTCGSAEIGDFRRPGDIGYVFFHSQDTDSALLYKEIHLSFGTYEKDDTNEKSTRIGQIIADSFKENGFEVEWVGSSLKRPKITLTDEDVEELRREIACIQGNDEEDGSD